jgi:uncharacterized protein YkwD
MPGMRVRAAMAAALITAAGATAISGGTAVHAARGVVPMSTWSKAMLHIVNADRTTDGLPPLRLTSRLTAAAAGHSVDMADHRYFAHRALNGETPFQRMRADGVRFRTAGENLGEADGGSPGSMLREINTLMLHSPEHRANLLDPLYRRVGISVVLTGHTVYVNEDFAG